MALVHDNWLYYTRCTLYTSSCFGQNTYRNVGSDGTGWLPVEGSLKQIAIGTNSVFGVNGYDQIFYRAGITSKQPSGTTWVLLDGNLKHITVSPAGVVWGVNSANQVSAGLRHEGFVAEKAVEDGSRGMSHKFETFLL